MKVAVFALISLLFNLNIGPQEPEELHSITIEVYDLRNSKGTVHFALYNDKTTFPDQKFEKHLIKGKSEIIDNKSVITFHDVPKDTYAVAIFHDENNNNKIDKGLILPKEGLGFSNYTSLNIKNKPRFSRASFELTQDETIKVKTVYM